ncbi:MAG: retroviral-like aspartic protease family protein [Verrucomicrobiota bacterium]
MPKLLVDTGSEFTWVAAEALERIGVKPVKKDLPIQMANGQIVTRTVGYAILRVDKYETIDEVVFAQKGDLTLLGSRALEGMNVHLDARRKRLVAAGPVVAAPTGSSRTVALLNAPAVVFDPRPRAYGRPFFGLAEADRPRRSLTRFEAAAGRNFSGGGLKA